MNFNLPGMTQGNEAVGNWLTGNMMAGYGDSFVPNAGGFDFSSTLPDYAQMGNWGGPATTFGGRVGEAYNGLTNGISNTLTRIGESGPVTTFKSMPGTDQMMALAGTASALGGLWNGYNQNRMAKKQFNLQRDMWNQQWGASKQQYNTQLADRQSARVASNPNAYQSVSSYMNQYGMK